MARTTASCQKYRIGLACVSLRAGGIERIVTRLADHFVVHNEVDLILMSPKESFFEPNPAVRISRFVGQRRGVRSKLYYPRLAKFVRATVRDRRLDVLLVFGEEISPFIRLATIGLPTRVFVFTQGSPDRSLRGILGWVSPIVFPFSAAVVTQTEETKRILRKSRYRFCRFRVIPNPIELPLHTPDLGARPKVVINVASIGRLKNQIALLRLFARSDAQKEWELHFVGDGPDRPYLEAESRDMGLGDRVKFLGERRDVPELLCRAQVFAFTSLSEGFPNALAEGLAHGCACISYDCPTGPSDLIRDDVNGLLIPMGDERHYEEGLTKLLNDAELRVRLGTEAKSSMTKFASDRIMGKFEELVTSKDL